MRSRTISEIVDSLDVDLSLRVLSGIAIDPLVRLCKIGHTGFG